MKIYILSVLIITILVNWSVVAGDPPLRAMLYCYLPAVNTDNPIPQYANLARIINQKLQTANINVRVQVCDPNGNGGLLYDQTKINSLFNTYDILEVDVSYLWAITDQTQLLTFKKTEIDYYNSVHPFEWQPTTKYIDGQEQIIGSPGLLCSSFLEDRRGQQYENRLYSKFVSTSAYGLVDLYLNLFINGRPERTLNDVDYTSTDKQTIRNVAAFLASCQPNPAKFNYDSNWCLKKLSRPFFQTDYSTTTGYSENLFNFLNNGIKEENIMISHITGIAPKKVFFVDSFVAKRSTEQRKKEVLDFYRFMLSDEVLDVYVKGLYTNSPKTTYLLPPTISYFEKLVRQNRLYQSISDTAFHNKVQYPLYQRAFAQNVFSFATLINQALQGLGNEQGEL